MRVHHIFYGIFPPYLKKSTIFEKKKNTERKMYFDFLWNIFL